MGGGPAGIAAAIASARNGTKTMLIERCGFVGGMATAALVGPFMTCYDGSGEIQIIKGIFDELVRRLEKAGGAIHPSKVGRATSHAAFIREGHMHVTPFDSEILKIVAEDMMQDSGVELLYYTQFIDCIVENNRIIEVIVAKKEGLCAIKASIVIDCSGDANVAVAAGVPTVLGREKDNKTQPATMFLQVCNVDSDSVKKHVEENKELVGKPFFGAFSWLIEEGRRTGEWDIKRGELGAYETNNKGEWKLNTTRVIGIDATKSSELTRASIEGRKQVIKVYKFLKDHVPGFENAKRMGTGSVIGVRETRHIKGKYIIEKEDVLQSRTFDDDILLCSNAIDIHSDDGSSGGEYVVVDKWYGIPYRSLVPLNCQNLLVAGRAISATSEAASAFRVMPCCCGIGQAAGTAAAIAVLNKVSPDKVNVYNLQRTLINQGVFLNK